MASLCVLSEQINPKTIHATGCLGYPVVHLKEHELSHGGALLWLTCTIPYFLMKVKSDGVADGLH